MRDDDSRSSSDACARLRHKLCCTTHVSSGSSCCLLLQPLTSPVHRASYVSRISRLFPLSRRLLYQLVQLIQSPVVVVAEQMPPADVSQDDAGKASCFQRLPQDVLPTAYRLHLHPNLVHCCFTGTVDVDVVVRRQTSSIVLNAADLSVDGARFTVSGAASRASEAKSVELREKEELLLVTLPSPLEVGTW